MIIAIVLSYLIENLVNRVKPRFPIFYTLSDAIEIHKDLKMVEAKLMSDPYAIANQKDYLGRTPLWQAISLDNDFDSVEIVRLLITYGANLNKQCFGITPLSLAVKVGNSEIVKLLIENGATINAFDDSGNTALETAFRKRQISILKNILVHQ